MSNLNHESLAQQLDRLVDGELDDLTYRRLVSSLDETEGGWKQCAIAFLESQTLQNELALIQQDINPPPVRLKAIPRSKRNWHQIWMIPLAMAASFLAAFAFATRYNQLPSAERESRSAIVQKQPTDSLGGELVLPVDQLKIITQGERASSEQPAQHLHMVVNEQDQNGPREFALPIYDNIHDFLQHAQRVSPGTLSEVDMNGLRLRRQTHMIPIDLGNGQRAFLQAEEFEWAAPDPDEFQ